MSKTFVGARLRQLRTERGLSQAALAKTLDISAATSPDRARRAPLTVPVLLRISEVFGVDTTFFSSQDDTRLIAELREVALDKTWASTPMRRRSRRWCRRIRVWPRRW